MGDPNLVTTCTFHGQEYLFKMSVLSGTLEVLVTDKNTGEEWQCSYDATYIENLTQKTGNFKQFDIFVAMLKSGLLRTSECVSLDLLTFEDLELLRSRKLTKSVGMHDTKKRYLILTYIVEFDKIRYPLPMEYCGPPDPVVLQTTIRRLEVELAKAKEELAMKSNNSESRKVYYLQKRVEELTDENLSLHEVIRQLSSKNKTKKKVIHLQTAVSNLEKSVVSERNSHHELVKKLRQDKIDLTKQLGKLRDSERSLKMQLNRCQKKPTGGDPESKMSVHSCKTMYRRPISRTNRKNPRSASSASSVEGKFLDPRSRTPSPLITRRIRSSSNASTSSSTRSSKSRKSKEYRRIEEQIGQLQQLLKSNLRSS